jgi:uncharacterized MnhB-related membrane protein
VTPVTVFLLLLPVLAVFSLTQRRRLIAVIGMGLFSLVLAATYLFFHAPDVAITETAIGAALVTFIYVLAIRKTGRLVVVYDEAPSLMSREGGSIVGLEEEILSGLARKLGLDLIVRNVSLRNIGSVVRQGEADIAAGGIIRELRSKEELVTEGFLPSALYHISKGALREKGRGAHEDYFDDVLQAIHEDKEVSVRLDLARFLAASRHNLSGYIVERIDGEFSYGFVVSPEQPELLRKLNEHLRELASSGEMGNMIHKYLS